MKTISNLEAQTDIDAVLDCAQNERVVVTRNGRPSAVILGLESYDDEDLQLASSAEFWRLISERRSRGASISLSELKTRLTPGESGQDVPSGGR
jgi:prevent-host-death family protein